MMLAQPSGRLSDAIASLRRLVLANTSTNPAPTYDAELVAVGREPHDEQPLDRMVRRTLLSTLEERQTRRPG
jgi:hypothetical protein